MQLLPSNIIHPFEPALRTLRRYTLGDLRADMLAGLTVSVVEIPQAMAYALIAGVPPQYGIYTSIIQGILGALLSSSEHLTTGPTNTQSLLIAAAVQRLVGDPANPLYLEMVFALALLKGVIQLIFAFAGLGNLIRYVGRSVILGVASGAGVLIIVGQLEHALGLRITGDEVTLGLPGVLDTVHRVLLHLPQTNPRAVLITVGALAVIGGSRTISPFVPGALISVVLGAAVVWLSGWTSDALPLVPALPQSLPGFHVPQVTFAQAENLLPGALALALLGLIESVAIVKSIASHTGERIDPNQEFFAQGVNNALTSFLQCIPGSGSFTRSALDYQAGGRTRFAAVFNGLFVMTIYLCAAPAASRIPLASLAAVLLVIAVGLIDWRYFLRVWRTSRSDAAVFATTFLATILLPLTYAVFMGIFVNLAVYLRNASRLHIAEMVRTSGGPFVERPVHDRQGHRKLIFLQLEGDLFFGVADELQDQLSSIASSGVRVVLLRLKRTHSVDATALGVLEQFARLLSSRGGHVILCGVKPELRQVFDRYGLTQAIGRENVFEAGYGVFTSAKRALDRARQLLGSSLDVAGLDLGEESEGWAYEI